MAGAPLGHPSPGDLNPGTRILVYYEGDTVWHTRYLLSLVDRASWIIITPDGDIYSEEVSDGNPDWAAWRLWPAGGGVPFGVDANAIYGFNPPPNAATLQNLISEGHQHAAQERARLGLAQGGQGGGVAGAAHGADPQPVGGAGAVGLPAGAGQPHGPGNLAGGGGGGNAQLAQLLHADQPMENEDAMADDARTLAISRDSEGNRYKEFRLAVQESRPCNFADWPISGPRTAKFVLTQMLEHGGSPMGHHQAWRTACRLCSRPMVRRWNTSLGAVFFKRSSLTTRWDGSNLAGIELIVRALQRIEEKHKHKLVSDRGWRGECFVHGLLIGKSGRNHHLPKIVRMDRGGIEERGHGVERTPQGKRREGLVSERRQGQQERMLQHHGSHHAVLGGGRIPRGQLHRCEVLLHPMWLFVLTFLHV